LGLPLPTLHLIGTFTELDRPNRRNLPQLLIDVANQRLTLLLARASADQRPRLRLDPHAFFAQPAISRSQPSPPKPIARPLRPYRLAVLLGFLADRRRQTLIAARIGQHARVVVENV